MSDHEETLRQQTMTTSGVNSGSFYKSIDKDYIDKEVKEILERPSVTRGGQFGSDLNHYPRVALPQSIKIEASHRRAQS